MNPVLSPESDAKLIVLAPGMPAFAAPEEPNLALVSSTELAEPPEREVVLALGAFDGNCREDMDLPLLLHDYDLLFTPFPCPLQLVVIGDFPVVPAFPAFQEASRGHQQALALRTEHRFSNLVHIHD
jgi:hypothetical protein